MRPCHHRTLTKNGTPNPPQRKIQHGEHFYGLGTNPATGSAQPQLHHLGHRSVMAFTAIPIPLTKTYFPLHRPPQPPVLRPFFDNTFKSHFDFGKTRHDTCNITFEGGEINQYIHLRPRHARCTVSTPCSPVYLSHLQGPRLPAM